MSSVLNRLTLNKVSNFYTSYIFQQYFPHTVHLKTSSQLLYILLISDENRTIYMCIAEHTIAFSASILTYLLHELLNRRVSLTVLLISNDTLISTNYVNKET